MFVFFAALLSSASAADLCCGPDQWEGDVGLVMGIVSQGQTTYVEGTMRMTFDKDNKITAYNQSLVVDGNPIQQRIVNDHKNDVMYIMSKDGCHKTNAAPWVSGCIPDNATQTTDHVRYGLGNNSVAVKGYLIKYPGYDAYIGVTRDSCVPVAEILTGNLEAITGQAYGPTETMESLTFANIKKGIADRSAFNVPAQCESATPQAVGRRSLIFI